MLAVQSYAVDNLIDVIHLMRPGLPQQCLRTAPGDGRLDRTFSSLPLLALFLDVVNGRRLPRFEIIDPLLGLESGGKLLDVVREGALLLVELVLAHALLEEDPADPCFFLPLPLVTITNTLNSQQLAIYVYLSLASISS